MLLTALTNCDNQQIKESVELIKISSKSQEMMILLDFALSMIRNNPTPIRENIYDTATDGIRELNQQIISEPFCIHRRLRNRIRGLTVA